MKKFTFLITLAIVFGTHVLTAQCDYPFPPVDLFTEEIPILCSDLDGYCSTLPPQYTNTVLPGCPADQFSIHNAQLIRFVPATTSLQIRITPTDCQGTTQGVGMQAAIYALGHPYFEGGWPMQVNCGYGVISDIILEGNTFEIGKPYVLMMDGWAGDVCEYYITVEQGLAEAQELVELPFITGNLPNEVCTGQTITLAAEHPEACLFNWTVTGGIITSGEGTHEITVEVTDASNFSVCVAATNGCFVSPELCLSIPEGVYLESELALNAEICEGESYDFNGVLLTDEGVYIDSVYGDCTIEIQSLTLQVLQATTGEDSGLICENGCYDWDGMQVCGPGTYEATFVAANGCDSVVTLTLELNNEILNSNFNANLCPAGYYDWNGEIYNTAGEYEQVFESYSGCDSVVTLNLMSNEIVETFAVTMCSGHFINFEGVNYNSSGTYVHSFVTDAGCDSLRVLILEELPPVFEELSETVCEGESYMVGNNSFSETGEYVVELLTDIFCDSLVYLDLTVLENVETTIDTSLLAGEVYNGIPIYQDTVITETYTAANGCDSVVTINIDLMLTNVSNYAFNNQFQLFPNPASHYSILSFTLEEPLEMQVALYSVHGKKIRTLQSLQTVGIGEHHLNIEVDDLTAATYLIFVKSDKSQQVIKMVVD